MIESKTGCGWKIGLCPLVMLTAELDIEADIPDPLTTSFQNNKQTIP